MKNHITITFSDRVIECVRMAAKTVLLPDNSNAQESNEALIRYLLQGDTLAVYGSTEAYNEVNRNIAYFGREEVISSLNESNELQNLGE